MNKKLTISLLIGIVFSGAALYLAFKNIPLKELSEYLLTINYFWMIPATAVIYWCFLLRTLRWQLIVSASNKIDFKTAYHPLMIGFMLNCIMPARVGELARPVILKQKSRVPFTTGLATLATERFFDLLFMITLLSLVLSLVQIDADLSYTYKSYTLNRDTLAVIGKNMLMLCIFLIVGILIISINASRKLILRIIEQIPIFLSFKNETLKNSLAKYFASPLASFIENISSGFVLVKQPVRLAYCVLLSIALWTSQIFSYYLFQFGCPGVNLSFFEMSAVLIIVCFFIALPSVPGFWGLWEAGGIFAMTLFSVPSNEAAGFTLANHALQVIPVIIIGLYSAMVTSINIFTISQNSDTVQLENTPD